jgi:hypothetical protein
VNVSALKILNELDFKAFRVRELADGCGNRLLTGELRCAEAARTGNEFIRSFQPSRQRTDDNRLQNAVYFDVLSQFLQFGFVKSPPRVTR